MAEEDELGESVSTLVAAYLPLARLLLVSPSQTFFLSLKQPHSLGGLSSTSEENSFTTPISQMVTHCCINHSARPFQWRWRFCRLPQLHNCILLSYNIHWFVTSIFMTVCSNGPFCSSLSYSVQIEAVVLWRIQISSGTFVHLWASSIIKYEQLV